MKNKYVTHEQTTTTELQTPDLGQAHIYRLQCLYNWKLTVVNAIKWDTIFSSNANTCILFLSGEIWEKDFDPVHVSMRALYKKDLQSSMDRYTD